MLDVIHHLKLNDCNQSSEEESKQPRDTQPERHGRSKRKRQQRPMQHFVPQNCRSSQNTAARETLRLNAPPVRIRAHDRARNKRVHALAPPSAGWIVSRRHAQVMPAHVLDLKDAVANARQKHTAEESLSAVVSMDQLMRDVNGENPAHNTQRHDKARHVDQWERQHLRQHGERPHEGCQPRHATHPRNRTQHLVATQTSLLFRSEARHHLTAQQIQHRYEDIHHDQCPPRHPRKRRIAQRTRASQHKRQSHQRREEK